MARVVKVAEVRREELLALALRLFMTVGFERTSVEQITREAGVAKGTFYHYFASKQDLLAQLVDSYADQLFTHVEQALAAIEGDAVARLKAFSRLSTSFKLEHRDESVAFGRMLYADENLMLRHKLYSAWFERTRPLFGAILEQGIAEGSFSVADSGATAGVVLSIWYDWGDRLAERVYLPGFDAAASGAVAADLRAGQRAQERILGLAPGTLVLDERCGHRGPAARAGGAVDNRKDVSAHGDRRGQWAHQGVRQRGHRRDRARPRRPVGRCRRVRRDHGPERLRQVHAAQPHRRARQAVGGIVRIGGDDIAEMDDATVTKLRRRRLGFVFQFFNLIPVLDAAENAALPLTLDGVAAPEARRRAQEWLVKVGLDDAAAQPPRPALRRSAAARRGRPGARDRAGPHPRRRAHRQPRFEVGRRDRRPAQAGLDRVEPRGGHGHPRRAYRLARRPASCSCATARSSTTARCLAGDGMEAARAAMEKAGLL